MGVIQDSEDHAVEEFEEVLKKRADVAALDRALAEHNEIMLSRALVILAHVELHLKAEFKDPSRRDVLLRQIYALTSDASIVDLPSVKDPSVQFHSRTMEFKGVDESSGAVCACTACGARVAHSESREHVDWHVRLAEQLAEIVRNGNELRSKEN